MNRKLFKRIVILVGSAFTVALIAVIALIAYVPGRDKDRAVLTSTSPDGRNIAEIHSVITPMWGGPDRAEIRLRHVGQMKAEVVYSQIFECDDFSHFRLRWNSPKELDVITGSCDSGTFNGAPSSAALGQKLSEWQGIAIAYSQSETPSGGRSSGKS